MEVRYRKLLKAETTPNGKTGQHDAFLPLL
jgi:hypothetical protein